MLDLSIDQVYRTKKVKRYQVIAKPADRHGCLSLGFLLAEFMQGKESLNSFLVGQCFDRRCQGGGNKFKQFVCTRCLISGKCLVWCPALGGPHQKNKSLQISSLVHARPRHCLPIAPYLARQPVNGPTQNSNFHYILSGRVSDKHPTCTLLTDSF